MPQLCLWRKGHCYNQVLNVILAAHALPMFREPRQRSTRKQLEKDRLDPLKSHKPEPPVAGPGDCAVAGGPQRVGAGGATEKGLGPSFGPGCFIVFEEICPK